MMTNLRTLATGAALLLAAAPLAAQGPDRGQRPALDPVPELTLPALQQLELANGLRVLLMEKHDLPLVQLNLLVDAGSVRDQEGRLGVASLTADMLDEGAAGRDALALADTFEILGARFGVSGASHHSVVSLRVPVARLGAALPLMADVVLRPDFPAAELERLRKERLTGLLRQHDDPNAIAAVLSGNVLFGKAHPYGRSSGGDAVSLRAIGVADLKEFHARYWRPGNATLVVVGDVTPAGVRPLLERAFASWERAEVSPQRVASAGQVEGRTIYLVDKPGSAQSVIRVGRIGAARDTPDYFALEVMNMVLGGAFTSRLNQNLREQHGYTYGAFSAFDMRPAPGPWLASAAVQTSATGPALSEFMNELRGMQEPVPEEEVARARSYLAARFPSSFQSVSGIAGRVSELVLYGLSPDYFNRYTERVLAVTAEDVSRVARGYIDPDNVAIFIVGDRRLVEPQVRTLGLGEVRILEIADVLGAPPEL
jgi:zinc protease